MKNGIDGLLWVWGNMEPSTALDIGSGAGEHAEVLRSWGWTVDTCDLKGGDYVGDFCSLEFPSYDLVWCCATLEHQRNPGLFLDKVHSVLNTDGWAVITVPPLKQDVVGGHVSLWNAGLLLYHMILARFDCSCASVLSDGYDITVCAPRGEFELPPLVYDHGDVGALRDYFPVPVGLDSFNGVIAKANW